MIRILGLTDMCVAASVHRAAFDTALPHLIGMHTPDEDRWFYREHVFKNCSLWGFFAGSNLLGHIALREAWVDQLYILPSAQRRGIGSKLLRLAQEQNELLNLWTFQCNVPARIFYECHGFRQVEKTDGNRNEEQEPDILYQWARPERSL
jgi:GNAT superfamily N-acetyltransferase